MLSMALLFQWKFVSTLWAFSHFTVNRGGATGTSKGSTISDIKDEAAFNAFNDVLRFQVHCRQRSQNGKVRKILKTFPKMLIKIVVTENLTIPKANKYCIDM